MGKIMFNGVEYGGGSGGSSGGAPLGTTYDILWSGTQNLTNSTSSVKVDKDPTDYSFLILWGYPQTSDGTITKSWTMHEVLIPIMLGNDYNSSNSSKKIAGQKLLTATSDNKILFFHIHYNLKSAKGYYYPSFSANNYSNPIVIDTTTGAISACENSLFELKKIVGVK